MSFNFGQFRRSQYNNYLTPINYTLDDENTQSTLSTEITYTDKAINLAEMITPTEPNSARTKAYYLKLRVYCMEDTKQKISVKLVNTTKKEDNTQIIKYLDVDEGSIDKCETFEIIISPINAYNQIKFELNRTIDDNSLNDNMTYGRLMNIKIDNLDTITDIVKYLEPAINNQSRLKQIGVQGPPGLLMCINGEEIRIGRSGIYEINMGYNVYFIGFIAEPGDKKYFMLDYQY